MWPQVKQEHQELYQMLQDKWQSMNEHMYDIEDNHYHRYDADIQSKLMHIDHCIEQVMKSMRDLTSDIYNGK